MFSIVMVIIFPTLTFESQSEGFAPHVQKKFIQLAKELEVATLAKGYQ